MNRKYIISYIMKAPYEKSVIQIDITNFCLKSCSNCSRLCSHYKQPFFMDFEYFKKAVDSLQDYKGVLGIIGGEPTLHPQFEQFCEYLQQNRLNQKVEHFKQPVKDKLDYLVYNMWSENGCLGLYTTLGESYYKYFETINDTFPVQVINDHNNHVRHQAILMSRKEYGISDEEWVKLRDDCWLQNYWSATITPKGAFFCEVAAAMDMLFDGPGGWEITSDWWKRKPEDFKEQLQWCEYCSICYASPKRLATDNTDDVSPLIYEKLLKIGSPRALNQRGRCNVINPNEFVFDTKYCFNAEASYMELADNERIACYNTSLMPHNFTISSWIEKDKYLSNLSLDWVLIYSTRTCDVLAVNDVKNKISRYVINPGCIYFYNNNYLLINVKAKSLKKYFDDNKKLNVWEYFPKDKIITINNL